MRFASLGSGSGGNGTVVDTDSGTVLIDCGFNAREAELRLGALGLEASSLSAILVTHEHSDHIGGVATLARRFNLPVYATAGTQASGRLSKVTQTHTILPDESFSVADMHIVAVPVPHDAREPVQFCITWRDWRVGILTDLGSITPRVIDAFSGCHGLLIEANHDRDALARGPYPATVKHRVAGDWGHLNNEQTRHLIEALDTDALRQLVIGHISRKNNTESMARAALKNLVLPEQCQVDYACQDTVLAWRRVDLPGADARSVLG